MAASEPVSFTTSEAPELDEGHDVGIGWQVGEPRLRRLFLPLGPMQQQPLLGLKIARVDRAVRVGARGASCGADTDSSEATSLGPFRALSPKYGLPGLLRQSRCERGD